MIMPFKGHQLILFADMKDGSNKVGNVVCLVPFLFLQQSRSDITLKRISS